MTNGLTLTNQREKASAALSSVVGAIFLTGMKIVVGVLTDSLGILAEAAHSGLDLVAAVITLMAVRMADRPADRQHLYGHGKIENLSALVETLLLLGTCVWIMTESVERLFFKKVHVDASVYAFIVMAISIAIDYSRSRMLSRAARKHNSQALEADALHFQTDIWSSAVVILGLICVTASDLWPRLAFLAVADAIAALGVAVIVVAVSIRLGKRTVLALLDTAPRGLAKKIKLTVEALPGVRNCHHVRVRASGPHLFVDAHVVMDGALPLVDAHALTEVVEKEIRRISPRADVTVHPEPHPTHKANARASQPDG